MHNYEVLKYASLVLLGIIIFMLWNTMISSVIGISLVAIGVVLTGYHHSLEQHFQSSPKRIRKP